MTTLITGGEKCGKSRIAENLLDRSDNNKFYIATMQPYGEEAFSAIERHRKIRFGKGFQTIEKYNDIHEITLPDHSYILLECIANLCANEMFRNKDIYDPTENIIRGIKHLQNYSDYLVIVTNIVGSDGVFYSTETNKYIEIMGHLNSQISYISDNVIECVYGVPVVLKGKLYVDT